MKTGRIQFGDFFVVGAFCVAMMWRFDRTGRLFYSTNYGGYTLLHGVQGGFFVKSFGKHGALHNPHAY